MKQQLFEDEELSERELEQNLESLSANIIPEFPFKREYELNEIEDRKTDIAQMAKQVKDKKAELAQITKTRKKEIDKLAQQIDLAAEEIHTGQYEVFEKVYEIPDHDEGLMGIYDRFGKLITTRKLNRNEQQLVASFGGSRKAM